MVDSYARLLAYAALEKAEGGGGGGSSIDRVYISNGDLHIVFTDGTDTNVGTVVGENGKVYIPHIDEHHILTWTVEDEAGEVPDPVDLNSGDEWEPMNDSVRTDYVWDSM